MKESYVIGITGGSGSGKTRFVKKLLEAIPEISCLSLDNYYLARHLQPEDRNGQKNFDTPLSLDYQKFIADLQLLKAGNSVRLQEYNYNNPAAEPVTVTVQPAPVLLAEGIFLFAYPGFEQYFDLKVFIEADESAKLSRRLRRDLTERGYDSHDVIYRYEHHIAPAYEQYIHPAKKIADIIVPNYQDFDKALEVMKNYIRHLLHT